MKLIKTDYDDHNRLFLVFRDNKDRMKCLYDFSNERLIIVWADINICLQETDKIIKLLYRDHFFEDERNVIAKRKYRKIVKKIKDYDIKATGA